MKKGRSGLTATRSSCRRRNCTAPARLRPACRGRRPGGSRAPPPARCGAGQRRPRAAAGCPSAGRAPAAAPGLAGTRSWRRPTRCARAGRRWRTPRARRGWPAGSSGTCRCPRRSRRAAPPRPRSRARRRTPSQRPPAGWAPARAGPSPARPRARDETPPRGRRARAAAGTAGSVAARSTGRRRAAGTLRCIRCGIRLVRPRAAPRQSTVGEACAPTPRPRQR
mmetsp:Transcript_3570/g.11137  ORF Transcript_3570/g.11137 Transcript_3570/m.11137 type:complete len:223 (+) Transcript_3570:267-935(+)|eukprot:scaffold25253_cov118-Isochrysis_galbana.AAC.2